MVRGTGWKPLGSASGIPSLSMSCAENGNFSSCKISCNTLTPARQRMRNVQVIGQGDAEVKIYPLRRRNSRYRSYQVSWYELGERRTKTLADPVRAKGFAQEVHVSLLNQRRTVTITPQDIQMFRDAETIVAKFGVSLPFAIREWADCREALRGSSMSSARRCPLLMFSRTVRWSASVPRFGRL